jgi:hypothetical protein
LRKGDEVKGHPTGFTAPVSTTHTMPSKKSVHLGQQGKAVRRWSADGFAVRGEKNFRDAVEEFDPTHP